MTEVSTPATPDSGTTAGALLRKAREAQGLHVAALATMLKIPPRKLEALERDRYDELPDAAFTRALAKSACRALKVDPAPVLALLPRPDADMLEHVSSGLNMPFRDRQGGPELSVEGIVRSPAFWFVLVLVVAALAVYFWPAGALQLPGTASTSSATDPVMPPAAAEPSVPDVAAPEPAAAPVTESVAPVVTALPTAAEAPAAAAAESNRLSLTVTEESWIQVIDANGKTLLSRKVREGENVDVDGDVPLRVTVGNATATTVLFRGVPVDLSAGTRNNVARLELR